MIVTNKTLSPQYLLWLGGPMATLLVFRRHATPEEDHAIGRIAGQLLVLALLTQLVYPLLYPGYLGRHGHAMIIISTVVTTIRNIALVIFTSRSAGWPGACWVPKSWREAPDTPGLIPANPR